MSPQTYDIIQERVHNLDDKNANLKVPLVINEDKVFNIISVPSNSQSQHKPQPGDLDMEKCLRDLYGAQRVVFKFLISLQVQELDGIFVTQPIATNEIALATKLPMNTITTVIGRLKIKKLLQTYECKPGRGGYGRYNFSFDIYRFFSKKFSEV